MRQSFQFEGGTEERKSNYNPVSEQRRPVQAMNQNVQQRVEQEDLYSGFADAFQRFDVPAGGNSPPQKKSTAQAADYNFGGFGGPQQKSDPFASDFTNFKPPQQKNSVAAPQAGSFNFPSFENVPKKTDTSPPSQKQQRSSEFDKDLFAFANFGPPSKQTAPQVETRPASQTVQPQKSPGFDLLEFDGPVTTSQPTGPSSQQNKSSGGNLLDLFDAQPTQPTQPTQQQQQQPSPLSPPINASPMSASLNYGQQQPNQQFGFQQNFTPGNFNQQQSNPFSMGGSQRQPGSGSQGPIGFGNMGFTVPEPNVSSPFSGMGFSPQPQPGYFGGAHNSLPPQNQQPLGQFGASPNKGKNDLFDVFS
eukprot:TRINITY_DN12779_c0_g1_i3.p1 TRINITY_DN12779_c0_g1~~TRINITY_DN12779_c0_g1_i3.p1  ORF type:complete len:361 (+),score=71.59 TRINITY_DN12779_c0_g1_i3:422-1504(+)